MTSPIGQEQRISVIARNLSYKFGQLLALDNFSLTAESGEVLALLGSNGAGKTTFLRIASKLIRPLKGSVSFVSYPEDATDKTPYFRLGYCPQSLAIWPDLTCYEQILLLGIMFGLTRSEAELRAKQLLDTVGLSSVTHELASRLSGGMQRRLNFTLALVNDPHILILDEPESGVDFHGRILFRDYIKTLSQEQKRTIFYSSQDIREVELLADRVAIMDHGRLLALDTPENLKGMLEFGTQVEITFSSINTEFLQLGRSKIEKMTRDISVTDDTIKVRMKSSAALPQLIDELKSISGFPSKVKIREPSLEDVFVHLTSQ